MSKARLANVAPGSPPSPVLRGLRYPIESPFGIDPIPAGIVFVRHPRARRYVLRVGRDRIIRVTIPRGGSETFARRILAEKRRWIDAQLLRLASLPAPAGPIPWIPGSRVWFRGERAALTATAEGVQLGDQWIRRPHNDTGTDWRPAVEAHLRRLAERELPPLVMNAAAHHQLHVQRVTVRNQRTRWGSCSRRGTISLNWHLIQTPTLVRDYLIAHELAHLREMNHSPRYWKVVATFFPAWREAEAWLKRHGRDVLHPQDPQAPTPP